MIMRSGRGSKRSMSDIKTLGYVRKTRKVSNNLMQLAFSVNIK